MVKKNTLSCQIGYLGCAVQFQMLFWNKVLRYRRQIGLNLPDYGCIVKTKVSLMFRYFECLDVCCSGFEGKHLPKVNSEGHGQIPDFPAALFCFFFSPHKFLTGLQSADAEP